MLDIVVRLVNPFRRRCAHAHAGALRLLCVGGNVLRLQARILLCRLRTAKLFKRLLLRSRVSASARGVASILLFVQIVHLISDNVFTHYTGYFPISQSHLRQNRETCRFSFRAQGFLPGIHCIRTRDLRDPSLMKKGLIRHVRIPVRAAAQLHPQATRDHGDAI